MVKFLLPDRERAILWRYFDGVSQALARRFETGSSPNEENLTFLLCELLDEGTTGLHLLEYPLGAAKQDLAEADGGFTLDVSYETHEHTKHIEHHFSGADLGIIFIVDHPYFGRSERAVLLQAKRLFPDASRTFSLNSSFSSFHASQRDLLKAVEQRFSASNSIFYLWYAPTSAAFSGDHARLIRAIEATAGWDWSDLRGWHPLFDELAELGPEYLRHLPRYPIPSSDDAQHQAWRILQPATRVSSLGVVEDITTGGGAPRLVSLYEARVARMRRRRAWRRLAFEPLAELFLLGLVLDGIGHSSPDWLRLARGEKVPFPSTKAFETPGSEFVLPEVVPAPRHSLTFTLRSSLTWPPDLRFPQ